METSAKDKKAGEGGGGWGWLGELLWYALWRGVWFLPSAIAAVGAKIATSQDVLWLKVFGALGAVGAIISVLFVLVWVQPFRRAVQLPLRMRRRLGLWILALAVFTFTYIVGIYPFGPLWPVDVWVDLVGQDATIRGIVEEKLYNPEGKLDRYQIVLRSRRFNLSETAWKVLRKGEPLEVGYKPRTRFVLYVAYCPLQLLEVGDKDALRVAVKLAPEERKVFEEHILPKFKEQTGINVMFVQIEAADLVDLLENPPGGKVPFDLLAVDNNALGPLVAKGLVEDLTSETGRIPAEVLPSMLPVTQFDGRTYFLPFRPNVQITYYNSQALERAGVSPPTTWDELLQAARNLKEWDQNGIGRLALKGFPGPPNATQVTEFIWQGGGDPLVLNDEGSVKAFTFLQSIYEYLSPKTKTAKYDTMNDYLLDDSIVLGQNWPFGVRIVVVDGGKREIKAYSGWSGPAGEFHVLGGDVLGVPTGGARREEALTFAEFLMSRDTQSTLAEQLAWPSIRRDAYAGITPELKPYWDAINEAMEKAKARPTVAYWPKVEKILNYAWDDIVVNGRDVKQTLYFYAKELNRIRAAPLHKLKLIYEDNFSNPRSGWPTKSTREVERGYKNSEYHIRVGGYTESAWVWNPDAGQLSDFALEIDARLVGASATTAYGLVFRLKDSENFYHFMVATDGHYLMGTRTNGEWTVIGRGSWSHFIRVREDTKHLEVVCRGSQIEIYVNGLHLSTFTDETFTEGGLGMIVEKPIGIWGHVAFDNIKVYSLD